MTQFLYDGQVLVYWYGSCLEKCLAAESRLLTNLSYSVSWSQNWVRLNNIKEVVVTKGRDIYDPLSYHAFLAAILLEALPSQKNLWFGSDCLCRTMS